MPKLKFLKQTAARLFTLLAAMAGLVILTEMIAPDVAVWLYNLIEAGYRLL